MSGLAAGAGGGGPAGVLGRSGASTAHQNDPVPVPALLHEAVLAGARWRDLPWRRSREPWAVLVSEVMLCQTQAERVAAAYEAFLDRFPTPAACAGAPLAEVLRRWQGLGYNRRALALHRAATMIRDAHGGRVPATLAELTALPGVGSYTARAVLAFAHGLDAAPVDTNVRRILWRAVAGASLDARATQGLADRLVPAGRAREWGEALMDLGATVCTAAGPDCGRCPLGTARVCTWRAAGAGAPDPAAGAGRRQGRFAGSDRQVRGRLVVAACAGPVPRDLLAAAAGCPADLPRAARLAGALVAEGLLAWTPDDRLAPA